MRTPQKTNSALELNLDSKVGELYNLGPAYCQKLARLGIHTIRGLLFYFPVRYDDLSSSKSLIEARVGEKATFKVNLVSINSRQTRNRRLTLTEAVVKDDTSSIKAVFFNQPYLTRILRPGETLILAGQVDFKPYLGRHIANPTYDKALSPLSPHLGRIVPIYSETKGLSSKWLRLRIKSLLKFSSGIKDYLPIELKDDLDLLDLDEAVRQIHFPDFQQSLKAAIRRLAFDELFLPALRAEIIKRKIKSQNAPKIIFDKKTVADFVKNLPFKLTNAQRRAAWEIINDLEGRHPMNRLLNGDVGSGKTIVAAIAALCVHQNGRQTAIMAPTEVLAYQHYHSFVELFKNYDLKIELLTGSYHLINKPLKKLKRLKLLNSDIIIGTHALIQEKIKFRDLALVVIDEQHRFGVKQRAAIRNKNKIHFTPHLLSMTATPIPRTLSLALYGDLDISVLDEYPQERKKISTYVVPPKKRDKAYDFIRAEIKKGRQAFVICPLIEKRSNQPRLTFDFDNRKAAIEEYDKLRLQVFPELKIGLLHGRMKSTEKEKIMNQFKKNKINILVSTSVVEIGVDIQNATVMMIEGAERFGLSQLHQFRGRVGRSRFKSYCFLFTDSWQEETKTRLKVMAATNNGFKIAEADLKLRGPGEIYGERQHGIADLRFASLFDYKLIQETKNEAEKIIRADPKLKTHPLLLDRLKIFENETHLE